MAPGSKGVNTKEEKLHQNIFILIFQNYINKSLQNNKQNIILSTCITKGSLVSIFQFYSIFTCTVHCTFSRLFHILDPQQCLTASGTILEFLFYLVSGNKYRSKYDVHIRGLWRKIFCIIPTCSP